MWTPLGTVCDDCGKILSEGEFPFCNGHGEGHGYGQGGFARPVHPRERTIVYRNPKTGAVRYPGRADAPMPQRYREQGYERVEFATAHSLSTFEKENKVLADHMHCNSGNHLCPENMREG